MTRLQFWKTANISWLIALLCLDRHDEYLGVSGYVYALAVIVAYSIMTSATFRRMPAGALYLLVVALAVGVQTASGSTLIGHNLPHIVTAVCILCITTCLSRRVAREQGALEDAALRVLAMDGLVKCLSGHEADRQFHQEMRRARRFERPIAMATIDAECTHLQQDIEAVTQRYRQQLATRYVQGQIGQLIANYTKTSDVLTWHDGGFRLLLPETDRASAQMLISRLADRCLAEFGVVLRTNVASFPEDELTLDGLMVRVVGVPDKDAEKVSDPDLVAIASA